MKHGKSNVQQWNQICNMRTTLLQLQYLYCQISQQVQQQNINFQSLQKDRLLQFYDICKQHYQLTNRNFKVLLIAKLESLLSVYVKIDEKIWEQLNTFIGCVKYIEQEMARDVCKLYIGGNMMMDIGKCEKQLKNIEAKIVKYFQENQPSIEEYNMRLKQLQQMQKAWTDYLKEVKQTIKSKIQPSYAKYLRKKLQKKQAQIKKNIKALQQFIKS